MGTMRAVYDMHREDGSKNFQRSACLSYFRGYSDQYKGCTIYPKLSFDVAYYEDFSECCKIAREIMPKGFVPYFRKDKLEKWNEGWYFDLSKVTGIRLFHMFSIMRYPQEQEDRWELYHELRRKNKDLFKSRYLTYVLSQLFRKSNDRTGKIYYGRSVYLNGGHAEFGYDTVQAFGKDLKKLMASNATIGQVGWGNAHRLSEDFNNGCGKKILNMVDKAEYSMKDIRDIYVQLRDANGGIFK